MQRRSVLNAAFAAALVTCAAGPAGAQSGYPTKPITMVVPFPPGGLADIVARPVADAMSRDLGQPVVIENRAGAGGGIGMAYAAKAPADGYTVLLALSSLTVIPEADAVLGRAQMFAPMRPGRPPRTSSRTPACIPVRSITAPRATTAPCTCRWKSWRRTPASR
jgi:tripartite-type tricarboxylate transporter receptor subunit TctC